MRRLEFAGWRRRFAVRTLGMAPCDGGVEERDARQWMGAVPHGHQEWERGGAQSYRGVPALPEEPQHGRVRLRPWMGRRGGACGDQLLSEATCRSAVHAAYGAALPGRAGGRSRTGGRAARACNYPAMR